MRDRTASNVPTEFLEATGCRYAFRRFGAGAALPLVFLPHFTGTLDNWDPAVVDPLASGREVILFDNAGIGRSNGEVPTTVEEMAGHLDRFLDALGIAACDLIGFSLGGMVAQELVRERPALVRRLILVGTAPRGGEDIMNLEKPSLAPHFADQSLKGYAILQKIFFAPTQSSQEAGAAFIGRLSERSSDRDAPSGPQVARAQLAAFRQWQESQGERFAGLKSISQSTLVICGVHDEMIPVRNSYFLSQNLPNALLLTYPNAGHGALFQFHESFTRVAASFLDSASPIAEL
jgi:pimeloyl-ACP methyl ester carboxylesterase